MFLPVRNRGVDNLEPATFKIDTSSVCSNCTKIAAQFVLQVFKFGFDLIFLRTTEVEIILLMVQKSHSQPPFGSC